VVISAAAALPKWRRTEVAVKNRQPVPSVGTVFDLVAGAFSICDLHILLCLWQMRGARHADNYPPGFPHR
jgi:hypothetical protein